MEIKRRLTKIANSLSPQIEVMNVADEMRRMCQRLEELIAYAQEKIDRANDGHKPIGQQVAEERAAKQKIIDDAQKAEAAENLQDQKEAFDERNRRLEKSQPIEDRDFEGKGELPDGTIMADPSVTVPVGQVGVTDEQLNPTKKKTKKKAKRKAKKKKA
jgi:hypothetical protein